MTVEAVPVGQVCNIKCSYCYENTMRDAGNQGGSYDVDSMIEALKQEGQKFTLFGGEPLLMKFNDLKKILTFGFQTYGGNGVQTNGTLITGRHRRLFRETKTHVGISIDGPGFLNDARASSQGGQKETRRLTRKTEKSIQDLLKDGIDVSLIVNIHKLNAQGSRLDTLMMWFKWLDSIGVKSARLHLLEGHHDRSLELTEAETISAFLDLAKFEMRELKQLRFDKFSEMLSLLADTKGNVSCVWNDCDSYTTEAVRGVNGDGSRSNCGRANKEGINWVKGDKTNHIRQLALYHTPQEDGGCADCRFFLVCRGHCPGTAIGQDWRNRTEHCGVIKAIYGHYEEVLLNARTVPVSLRPDRKVMEMQLLKGLQGNSGMINIPHEDWHLNQGKFTGTVPVTK